MFRHFRVRQRIPEKKFSCTIFSFKIIVVDLFKYFSNFCRNEKAFYFIFATAIASIFGSIYVCVCVPQRAQFLALHATSSYHAVASLILSQRNPQLVLLQSLLKTLNISFPFTGPYLFQLPILFFLYTEQLRASVVFLTIPVCLAENSFFYFSFLH